MAARGTVGPFGREQKTQEEENVEAPRMLCMGSTHIVHTLGQASAPPFSESVPGHALQLEISYYS